MFTNNFVIYNDSSSHNFASAKGSRIPQEFNHENLRISKFENWTNIIRHGHSARPTEKRGSSRELKKEAIRIGGPFHAFCKLWCSVDILRQALLHAPRTWCLYMCDRAHFRHHTYATIHKRGHPLIMDFQVFLSYSAGNFCFNKGLCMKWNKGTLSKDKSC